MNRSQSERAGVPARGVAAILCLGLCLFLPRPGSAHPASEIRIDDLTRRIAADPGNAALYIERGDLHRERRDWEAARADYAASRRLDPRLPAVDLRLGYLAYETGRHDEAIAALDRYLAASPDDAAALALRAAARAAAGRHLDAADDYRRAIALLDAGGSAPPPHLYLGRAAALAAAGDAHLPDAVRSLDEGIDRLGRPVTLEFMALDLEMRLGRFDAALARVDDRLAAARRSGPWLIKRGEVLERAGRYEAALAAYAGAREDLGGAPVVRRQASGAARQVASLGEAIARCEERLRQEGGAPHDAP
jgi:tetratricopeptide (TPR) repeat protein